MNIDSSQSACKNKHNLMSKSTTKYLIIASMDDDDTLSRFNLTNSRTMILNLNEKDVADKNSDDKKGDAQVGSLSLSSSSSSNKKPLNQMARTETVKRRKADLTCVVCDGHASGFNFDQICCESCKAFFRRHALNPIERAKCLNPKNTLDNIRCTIRHDMKQKCQRCRLLKCFESGMRKDFISTSEEKQLKQKRLEENRKIHLTQKVNNQLDTIKTEHTQLSTCMNIQLQSSSTMPSSSFTEVDWSRISDIQAAYLSASLSAPSASSFISLESIPDKTSAYMNTLDIQNFAAIKLINFIRRIPEFEELDESDRLILVKYNLVLLFFIRYALTFDATREIIYDSDTNSSISPTEEAFAHQCKSLFIFCYGYEFNRLFISILHAIVNIVENDTAIAQLIMINMLFLKGLSATDDLEASLSDNQRVFRIHSKFTDLLFRYLKHKTSYEVAVIKMLRIVELFIKIQRLMRDFHRYIKSNVDVNCVNPLMKSLLHLP